MVDSEPQPDIIVLRGHRRDYLTHHPTPEDVALVVEVAESSLKYDQTTKKRIYVQAGIAVYWIINLVEGRIEVYSEPMREAELPDYREVRYYSGEESLPVIIEGQEVGRLAAKDLLP